MIGAIDVGGTKIAVGLVTQEGKIAAHSILISDSKSGFKASVSQIANALQEMMKKNQSEIDGIGIGCTGPIHHQTGTLGKNSFLPNWNGKNLSQAFAEIFQVEVTVENDADAATLGEYYWGVGKGKQVLLCVMVGTGIGGGLALDGRLYRGVDGAHPEIGHHVIDPTGPLCYCGAHGCLESFASGRALENLFMNYAERGKAPLKAHEIHQMAKNGDALAMKAVDRQVRYLGIGLANYVTLFTPECIILGGGIMLEENIFIEPIKETIRSSCGLVPFEKTQILPTAFGSDAGLIGAAAVWRSRNMD
jgi:glucokinase